MKLIVDQKQRYAKMRAHTATHLLHAEITKIFPNTKQAGSFVDSDILRFDFQAERMFTNEEITAIEKNINNIIYKSITVTSEEMSLDDAKNTGAKAFFDEKYGDTVRVVSVKDSEENSISVELCGWTHISNTKEIGAFVIVGQESVASGIRRISALTWPKVIERINEIKDILDTVAQKLWVKTHTQILDKLEKELKEKSELSQQMESIQSKMLFQNLQTASFKSDDNFDKIINISLDNNLKDMKFKDIVFTAKQIFEEQNSLIYANEWNFAIIINKKWYSAKDISQNLGLKWWGNDSLVQGRDTNTLNIIN